MKARVVLTVAGSDSGGGAGIQTDLKTVAVMGCYGVSVLTALTAQNSLGVQAVHAVPPEFVEAQLESVLGDIPPAAAKTGMLATAQIVKVVARKLGEAGIGALVVDPVMVSGTGDRLIDRTAVRTLVDHLFPLAAVVTPNLHEASALLGRQVSYAEQMEEAARDLFSLGPGAVLLKGGHLEGSATDCYFDGAGARFFESPRIATSHTHGSGCALSAAIASHMALGCTAVDAVAKAKEFISLAIAEAYAVGKGPGPVNPLAWASRRRGKAPDDC